MELSESKDEEPIGDTNSVGEQNPVNPETLESADADLVQNNVLPNDPEEPNTEPVGISETPESSKWQVLFDRSVSSYRENWNRDSSNRGEIRVDRRGILTISGGQQVDAIASLNTNQNYDNFYFFANIENPDGIAKSIRIREGSDGSGYSISIGGFRGNSTIMPGSYSYNRRVEPKRFEEPDRTTMLKKNRRYNFEIFAFNEKILVRVDGQVVSEIQDSQRLEKSAISLICPANSSVKYHSVGMKSIGNQFDWDNVYVWQSKTRYDVPWSKDLKGETENSASESGLEKFVSGTVWTGLASRHLSGSPSKTGVPISLNVVQVGKSYWKGKLSIEDKELPISGRIKRGLSWKTHVFPSEQGFETGTYTGNFSNANLDLEYEGRIFKKEPRAHKSYSAKYDFQKPTADLTARGKAQLKLVTTGDSISHEREAIVGKEVEQEIIDFENKMQLWKQSAISELKAVEKFEDFALLIDDFFADPLNSPRPKTSIVNGFVSYHERAKNSLLKSLYDKFVEKSKRSKDWSEAVDVLEVSNLMFPNRFLVSGQVWVGSYAVNKKDSEQLKPEKIFELVIDKMDNATFSGTVRFENNDAKKVVGWFSESYVVFDYDDTELKLRHQRDLLRGSWKDQKIEFRLENQ